MDWFLNFLLNGLYFLRLWIRRIVKISHHPLPPPRGGGERIQFTLFPQFFHFGWGGHFLFFFQFRRDNFPPFFPHGGPSVNLTWRNCETSTGTMRSFLKSSIVQWNLFSNISFHQKRASHSNRIRTQDRNTFEPRVHCSVFFCTHHSALYKSIISSRTQIFFERVSTVVCSDSTRACFFASYLHWLWFVSI